MPTFADVEQKGEKSKMTSKNNAADLGSAKRRLSIKEWDEADRPREKLMNLGRQSLSNAELLAIIIGSGNARQSAVDLAKNILASVNNSLHEAKSSKLCA